MPAPKKKQQKKKKRKSQHHKQHKQNKSKQFKKQTNKQQNIYNNGCEGDIFLVAHGDDGTGHDAHIPFWGLLRGPILSLYHDKNKIHTIPYDIIDTSQYVVVMEFNQSSQYFITLSTKKGDVIKGSQVFLSIHKIEDRKKWFNSLQNIIQLCQTVKKNTSHKMADNNIIFSGYTMMNTKVCFIELTFKKLIVYNNNLWNRKQIRSIELKKHQNISAVSLNQKNTLLKYQLKFKIDDDSNNDLWFLFKKNNYRHELLTHIDYIINNELSQNDEKQNKQSQVNHKNVRNSAKIIQSALMLYEHWQNNKNKQESLQMSIMKKLNVNHLNILNCLHCVISNGRKDKIKTDIRCSSKNECQYIKRHKLREQRCSNEIECKNNTDSKRNDILFAELLDKAHFYLCHSENNDNNDLVRDNIANKFVIETQLNQNNNDEKEHNIKPDNQTAMFAFGSAFDYYNDKMGNYVKPHYSCLKEELTSNPYCKLSVNKYYNIYKRALQILNSREFKTIKATDAGIWNGRTGIDINESLTVNHIISLIIYCNETEIQKTFKKHTRRINNNESSTNIYKRQSFIAHWTRYLTESVLFYGTPLNENEYIYCGVDSKLIFDSMSFDNYCPLSTSSDLIVANNFATTQGIIMKLQRNTSQFLNCRCFDMMLLSDYPMEKEKFLCGMAKLKFIDILIDGNSNKQKVSALRLLELILNGTLFYYKWNKELYDIQTQMIAIEFLDDYVNDNSKDYFSKLTSALINSFIIKENNYTAINLGEKFLCLNDVEIGKLDERLRRYFDISSLPILFASEKWNENVKATNSKLRLHKSFVHQIKIGKNQLNKLRQIRLWVGHFEIGSCVVDGYKFEFVMEKHGGKGDDKSHHYQIVIYLKSKIIHSLKISWDMVCEQVSYQHSQKVFKLGKSTNYRSNSMIFLCSKIKKLDCLSIDLNIRILCIVKN